MPHYVFERTEQAIIQQGGSLEHSRVLLLGMAYKKDIGDTRESPGLHLMQLFEERGTARVDYHDPLVSQLPRTRDFPAFAGRSSVPLTPETLTAAAAVIIVTDHTEVDYAAVGEHARLVVDTRNIMRGVRMSGQLVQA
jgi:UDP-N-acetyl-D-glucosamine dehydrogenase